MSVPSFRYHPDPVATGSAVASEEPCSICEQPARWRYHGPVYGEQADVICLRCIANGVAAQRLSAAGSPADFADLGSVPEDVPAEVVDEIAHRTPGFYGWQSETWGYHCGDGAAFVGCLGWDELRDLPGAAESAVADLVEAGLPEGEARERVTELRPDGAAIGVTYRCLHCETHVVRVDLG